MNAAGRAPELAPTVAQPRAVPGQDDSVRTERGPQRLGGRAGTDADQSQPRAARAMSATRSPGASLLEETPGAFSFARVSRHHRGTCDGEGAGGGIGETQTARRADLNPESEQSRIHTHRCGCPALSPLTSGVAFSVQVVGARKAAKKSKELWLLRVPADVKTVSA